MPQPRRGITFDPARLLGFAKLLRLSCGKARERANIQASSLFISESGWGHAARHFLQVWRTKEADHDNTAQLICEWCGYRHSRMY